MLDKPNNSFSLGMEYDGATKSDFMNGYMWEVKVWNVPVDPLGIELNLDVQQLPSSTIYPQNCYPCSRRDQEGCGNDTEIEFCLPNCEF